MEKNFNESEEKELVINGMEDDALQPEEVASKASGHHHHHSHSHHSSHHRSHGHRRRRSKKSKLRSFFKKNSKAMKAVAFVLAMALVAGISVVTDRAVTHNGLSNGKGASTADVIREDLFYVGLPDFDGKVQISSEVARKYLANDISVNISSFIKGIKSEGRFDIGKAVELNFDIYGAEAENSVQSSKLEIADNAEFKNSSYYDLDSSYHASVWNLKTNTTYRYRLHLKLKNGNNLVYQGAFETAKAPRFLNIEGIGNARDIGGWTTVDGKTIKQGLLFRGTEIDGAVEKKYMLTEKGAAEMLNVLGIKFDMDLRANTDRVPGEYILGKNVTHRYYGAPMYGSAFDGTGKENIKNIFKDFSDKNNYPMYVHCTYGRDRTGTVCYLLGALLGMSEDDLIREYELSGLFYGSVNRSDIMTVYGALLSYEGATIKEKTENYLISIGVTEKEISNIRSIFLG